MKKLALAILATTSILLIKPVSADQEKPADQCVDGICIGDDLGQLSKIKWKDSGKKTGLSYPKDIERCAKLNFPQWKEKSQQMCEVVINSSLNDVNPEELVNFFQKNSEAICNSESKGLFRNFSTRSKKLIVVHPLGETQVFVGLNESGRPEVFSINKSFSEVTNEEDKKILLNKLVEKRIPNEKSREFDTIKANADWGETIIFGSPNIQLNLRSKNSIGEYDIYNNTPTKGACMPARKEIPDQ